MRIVTIVGARPQFIKAAVVSRQFALCERIDELLLHTGQHYDPGLSDIFFEELGLKHPTYNLGVGSHSHGLQTAKMLIGIEEILFKERPDCVLVYGDTNSTLAGALAAVKLNIPLLHVEAGLRSFNFRMPEEVNRILTDRVSTLLFAPTAVAQSNLLREGVAPEKVKLVGDVMYDAALHFAKISEEKSTVCQQIDLKPKQYILSTIHRSENTDDPELLSGIFCALKSVSENMEVVIPLHPRTRERLKRLPFDLAGVSGLKVLEPVGYLDMVQLIRGASWVVTDSGGLQKEAFFHRVPCVTLRRETEWVELVEMGWNHLVCPEGVHQLMDLLLSRVSPTDPVQELYGGGKASKLIVDEILSYFNNLARSLS